MNTDLIFDVIKADKFFKRYAPEVKSYKKKCSGKNSNGNPVTFTEADKEAIKHGLANFLSEAKVYQGKRVILLHEK